MILQRKFLIFILVFLVYIDDACSYLDKTGRCNHGKCEPDVDDNDKPKCL